MPLAIIASIVVLATLVGCLAGRHRAVNLEEWAIGGRGFGNLMVWFLMAGEIFTTYSLLGLSGWAYTRGAPVLYAMLYLPLAQIPLYFLGPRQWELGRRHGMVTLPDFFQWRFGGEWLPAFVALVSAVTLLVYLQLQLVGLGLIVEFASDGAIPRASAIVVASVLIALFVFVSGVRGAAWVSIIKDGLMTFAAVFAGIAIPAIHFGGVGPMFARLLHDHPQHFVLPGSMAIYGKRWFVTSVLVSIAGACTWPHTFSSRFTARSADVVRRNCIAMPVYVLCLLFITFVGFGAMVVVPGLKNGDLAFLAVVKATFPVWFLGLIGGAGALTAMVPAAVMLVTAATLVGKNLWPVVIGREPSAAAAARLSRWVVIGFSVVGGVLALSNSKTIAALLLLAYSGVAQFSPAFILGLVWDRATRAGIAAGLVAGLVIAGGLTLKGLDPWHGFNAGLVGLVVNFAVVFAVSRARAPQAVALGRIAAAGTAK
ncbi:MAG TPA: sodium:solute symporter family protein [Opitutaceae bacterium]